MTPTLGDLLLTADTRGLILSHVDARSLNHVASVCKSLRKPARCTQEAHVAAVNKRLEELEACALATREAFEDVNFNQYWTWWWYKREIQRAYRDLVRPLLDLHTRLRLQPTLRYGAHELLPALVQYVLNMTHPDLYSRAWRVVRMDRLITAAVKDRDNWLFRERLDAKEDWRLGYSIRLGELGFDRILDVQGDVETNVFGTNELALFLHMVDHKADLGSTLATAVKLIETYLMRPSETYHACLERFTQCKAEARSLTKSHLGRELKSLRRFSYRCQTPLGRVAFFCAQEGKG